MIRFFVKNIELILPKEYSFPFIEENPLITKNGEFSMDIVTSLLEANNARAFNNINRLNKSTIDLSGDCKMISDGIVKQGKFIVLSFTNNSVKWQFVSGNSELNFLFSSDKKIWSLDWGYEPEINIQTAKKSLYYPGYGPKSDPGIPGIMWNQNYVCCPVLIGDKIVNDYLIGTQANEFNFVESFYNVSNEVPLSAGNYYTLKTAIAAVPSGIRTLQFVIEFYTDASTLVRYQYNFTYLTQWESEDCWFEKSRKIIMMPYLLYYVNKLPELLGYELKENVLNNDDVAKHMYLLNASETYNYSDALPDISILEFIESVETFFNVTFVVNSKDKTIRIQNYSLFINSNQALKMNNAIDEFESELKEKLYSSKLNITKVNYDTSTEMFYQYHNLSEEVLSACEIKEFPNFNALENFARTLALSDHPIIYRDIEKQHDYFYVDINRAIGTTLSYNTESPNVSQFNRLYRINKFRSWGNDTSNQITLKIQPASIFINKKYYAYTYSSGNNRFIDIEYQLAKSSNTYYKVENYGFVELVEDGIKEIPRLSKLEVALYSGNIQLYNLYNEPQLITYPFSHVDNTPEYTVKGVSFGTTSAIFLNWVNNVFNQHITTSLRLIGVDGIVNRYIYNHSVDTSRTYSFEFDDNNEVIPDRLFINNNLEYMPIRLERQISNKKRTRLIGYFYRMK